jgi:two-component system, OmpR family, sensor histidine kinase KdpD
LLDNALKFSPAGSPVMLNVESDGRAVRFHVEDEGDGFVDGDHAFEPFHAEGKASGAGLGLAIARGFAEANGARVWAEPSDAGAHLVLELPLAVRATVPA